MVRKVPKLALQPKILTQRWLQIMVMGPKQAVRYNYFVVFWLLCSYYVTDVIKKLELMFTGSYNFI